MYLPAWVFFVIIIIIGIVIENHMKKQKDEIADQINNLEGRIYDLENFVGLDEDSLKQHKEIKMNQEMFELSREHCNKQNQDKEKNG